MFMLVVTTCVIYLGSGNYQGFCQGNFFFFMYFPCQYFSRDDDFQVQYVYLVKVISV